MASAMAVALLDRQAENAFIDSGLGIEH